VVFPALIVGLVNWSVFTTESVGEVYFGVNHCVPPRAEDVVAAVVMVADQDIL